MSSCRNNSDFPSCYFIQSKRLIVTSFGEKIKIISYGYHDNLTDKDTCFNIEINPPQDSINLMLAFRRNFHLSFDSIYLESTAFGLSITTVDKDGLYSEYHHDWLKCNVKSDVLKIPFMVL
jgi:hypothetical protein